MSDFGKTKPTSSVKEIARQQILDLKCSVCQDVPGFLGLGKIVTVAVRWSTISKYGKYPQNKMT